MSFVKYCSQLVAEPGFELESGSISRTCAHYHSAVLHYWVTNKISEVWERFKKNKTEDNVKNSRGENQ